jgi:hypothetical protein
MLYDTNCRFYLPNRLFDSDLAIKDRLTLEIEEMKRLLVLLAAALAANGDRTYHNEQVLVLEQATVNH